MVSTMAAYTCASGTPGRAIPMAYCNMTQPYQTSFKLVGAYTIPRIDVLLSTSAQFLPGREREANWRVTNAIVSPLLGRPLAGNAANVTLNLALPGNVYPERLNTVDMRVTKLLRFGRTRSNIGIDLYNLFNANTGTAFNNTFGSMTPQGTVNSTTWLRPTSILNARFVRFNATVDF